MIPSNLSQFNPSVFRSIPQNPTPSHMQTDTPRSSRISLISVLPAISRQAYYDSLQIKMGSETFFLPFERNGIKYDRFLLIDFLCRYLDDMLVNLKQSNSNFKIPLFFSKYKHEIIQYLIKEGQNFTLTLDDLKPLCFLLAKFVQFAPSELRGLEVSFTGYKLMTPEEGALLSWLKSFEILDGDQSRCFTDLIHSLYEVYNFSNALQQQKLHTAQAPPFSWQIHGVAQEDLYFNHLHQLLIFPFKFPTSMAGLHNVLPPLIEAAMKDHTLSIESFSRMFFNEIVNNEAIKVSSGEDIQFLFVIMMRILLFLKNNNCLSQEEQLQPTIFNIEYWLEVLKNQDRESFNSPLTQKMLQPAMEFVRLACLQWFPFKLGSFSLPEKWRSLCLKARSEVSILMSLWVAICYPKLWHPTALPLSCAQLLDEILKRYLSYPPSFFDPAKYEKTKAFHYAIKCIIKDKPIIEPTRLEQLLSKLGVPPQYQPQNLPANLSNQDSCEITPLPISLEEFMQDVAPQEGYEVETPSLEVPGNAIQEELIAESIEVEHKKAKADFAILNWSSYQALSSEVQQAVRQFWKKEAEIISDCIVNIKHRTISEQDRSPLYQVGGLWRVGEESIPFKNEQPSPLLTKQAERACLSHARAAGGFLTSDQEKFLFSKYKEEMLPALLAAQVAPLLYHIKKRELRHYIADFKTSLQQTAAFEAERKIPSIFIYYASEKICAIPLQALFLNGHFQGLLLDKEDRALNILKEDRILQISEIDHQPVYCITKEALQKLRLHLEQSQDAIPPYLILQRKTPLEEVSGKAKQTQVKIGKRKRIPGKGDDILKARPIKQRKLDVKKNTSNSRTAPLTSRPHLSDFWKMQSLESAGSVIRRAVERELVKTTSQPLAWTPEFIQKILSIKYQTCEAPIWNLKTYQLNALSAVDSLAASQLNGIIALDMGLGKTITFTARIAQYIAKGGNKNILVINPKTTSGQTKRGIIHYFEEAQLTAILDTWSHWKDYSPREQQLRVEIIYKWLRRIAATPALADEMDQSKRLERIWLVKAHAPEEVQQSYGARLSLIKSQKPKQGIQFSEITSFYKDFQRFKNILNYNVSDSVISINDDCSYQPRIICVTYPMLAQHKDLLMNQAWGLIIFDEAQNIHKKGTQRTQAAQEILTLARKKSEVEVIHSTGTPFENSFSEVLTLLEIANEHCFSEELQLSLQKLCEQAKKSLRDDNPNIRNEMVIQAFLHFRIAVSILNHLILHKSKEDPDVITAWENRIPQKVVRSTAIDSQNQTISELAFERLKQIGEDIKNKRINFLNGTRKECLALTHQDLTDANINGESFKQVKQKIIRNPKDEIARSPLGAALVHHPEFINLQNDNKEALVFTHFKSTAEITKIFINSAYPDSEVRIMNGDTPEDERIATIAWMQESKAAKPRILIISLQTGGVGLNFPAVERSFFLTGSFNPAALMQAEDRIVRAGNTGQRHILHFSFDTVSRKHEEIIIQKKKAWNRFVFSPDGSKKLDEFALEPFINHLMQFITVLVAEDAHDRFMQEGFAPLDTQSIQAEICEYFTLSHKVMEKRFQGMQPRLPQPPASSAMEIESEQQNPLTLQPKTMAPPAKTLHVKDYLIIPLPGAKREPAIALGSYIQTHLNDTSLKEGLKALQTAQEKDPRVRSMIRDGFVHRISDQSIRDFYVQIDNKIESQSLQKPSVVYYDQQDQFYHWKESTNGSEGNWLTIRKSYNLKEKRSQYDLLMPRMS